MGEQRAPIGLGNEKLLRMMVVVVLGDQAPGIEADPHAIVSMDILPIYKERITIPLCFGAVRINRKRIKAWSPSEAAA